MGFNKILQKLLFIIIILLSVVSAKELKFDISCKASAYNNSNFIVICNDKILEIDKKLNIKKEKEVNIKPTEVIRSDNNLFVLDVNNSLYKLNYDLKLKKIKTINLKNKAVYAKDIFGNWLSIKDKTIYLPFISEKNETPIIVKYDLIKNTYQVYNINLKDCLPIMHIKYKDNELVLLKYNSHIKYDILYNITDNKIFLKSDYSKLYFIKKFGSILSIFGVGYNKELKAYNTFVINYKEGKLQTKHYLPTLLMPFVFTEDNKNKFIYGIMPNINSKVKGIGVCNINNNNCKIIEKTSFYAISLVVKNKNYKALFLVNTEGSKIYIFNKNKIVKIINVKEKLSPLSNLFIQNNNVYLWNVRNVTNKIKVRYLRMIDQ